MNPENIEKEAAAKAQGDVRDSLYAAVPYEWFFDLAKSAAGGFPRRILRCQSCLKRITSEVGFRLCTRCSSWICCDCLDKHGKSCYSEVKVCLQTCVECCQMVCGLIDCASNLQAYHVCGFCVLQAIDRRHPASWSETFVKDYPTKKTVLSYNKQKLAATRIFQMLKDTDWFFRNSSWLTKEGVEKWNNFQRCYNNWCVSECPKSLALIYAATLDYQDKALSTCSASGKAFTHSIALWRDLLSSDADMSMINAIDITGRLLSDGSPALGKLLAIAQWYEYEFDNYPNLKPADQGEQAPEAPMAEASTSSVLTNPATMRYGWHMFSSLSLIVSTSIDKAFHIIAGFGVVAFVLMISLIGFGTEKEPLSYLT